MLAGADTKEENTTFGRRHTLRTALSSPLLSSPSPEDLSSAPHPLPKPQIHSTRRRFEPDASPSSAAFSRQLSKPFAVLRRSGASDRIAWPFSL